MNMTQSTFDFFLSLLIATSILAQSSLEPALAQPAGTGHWQQIPKEEVQSIAINLYMGVGPTYEKARNIEKKQVQEISRLRFLDYGTNILIFGATGVGKTYLATAIGNHVCRS